MTDIDVVLLHPLAQIPHYAQPGDAGADLSCVEHVSLKPGQRELIATGVAIAIPDGHVGLIHPRSGLATKIGLGIVNAPGTIDSGYRGEIKVCLINLDSQNAIELEPGTRIAQLVIQRVEQASFRTVAQLDETARGAEGFGSTGLLAHQESRQADPQLHKRRHDDFDELSD